MTKNEVLKQIYDIVLEAYPDAVRVDIAITCEGIEITASDKLIAPLAEYSMRKIDGSWCDKVKQGG